MPAIAPLFNLGQPTASLPSGTGTSSGGTPSFHSVFGQAVTHHQTSNSSPSRSANQAFSENGSAEESIPGNGLQHSATARSWDAGQKENASPDDRRHLPLELETDWDGIPARDSSWLTRRYAALDAITMHGSSEGSRLQGHLQPAVTAPIMGTLPGVPGSSRDASSDFTSNDAGEDHGAPAQGNLVKILPTIGSYHEALTGTTGEALGAEPQGRSATLPGQPAAHSDMPLSAQYHSSSGQIFSGAAINAKERTPGQGSINPNLAPAAPASPTTAAAVMREVAVAHGTKTSLQQIASTTTASGGVLHPAKDAFTVLNGTAGAAAARNEPATPAGGEAVMVASATGTETDAPATRPIEWVAGRVNVSQPLPQVKPDFRGAAEGNLSRFQGTITLQGAVIQAEFVKGEPVLAAATHNPLMNGSLEHLGQIAAHPKIVVEPLVESVSRSQSTGSHNGTLMVSLQQLTSLQQPGNEAVGRHTDRADGPLREQFREHMQRVQNAEANQGDGALQSPTGRQEQNGTPLVLSPAQTAVSSHFGETITMPLHGQTPVGQGTIAQPGVQPQSPAVPQPLHDNLVYQQVADHFQVQMRNQQTRLHIQLQPAELGKMEIQLTVKEGGVRAQVMVQSGQVQEILERNLNKLRTILEAQGFTVEDLIVAQRSETPADMDLFQQQLTRHQADEQHQHGQSGTIFSDTLEDAVNTLEPPQSGVNIRA